MTVPDGFVPHERRSPLTRPWEPIYAKRTTDRVLLGLVVGEPHTNSRGLVHGGLIAALADNAMGLSLGKALIADGVTLQGAVTTSLSIDYLGHISIGEWLEFVTGLVHFGKSTAVTDAVIFASGRIVARANASFSFR